MFASDDRMVNVTITHFVLLLLGALVLIQACPKQWEKSPCGDHQWCVRNLTTERRCIRQGGIPGVLACLDLHHSHVQSNATRMCVKDMKNGDFGFAKNLQKALEEMGEESDDDEGEGEYTD